MTIIHKTHTWCIYVNNNAGAVWQEEQSEPLRSRSNLCKTRQFFYSVHNSAASVFWKVWWADVGRPWIYTFFLLYIVFHICIVYFNIFPFQQVCIAWRGIFSSIQWVLQRCSFSFRNIIICPSVMLFVVIIIIVVENCLKARSRVTFECVNGKADARPRSECPCCRLSRKSSDAHEAPPTRTLPGASRRRLASPLTSPPFNTALMPPHEGVLPSGRGLPRRATAKRQMISVGSVMSREKPTRRLCSPSAVPSASRSANPYGISR